MDIGADTKGEAGSLGFSFLLGLVLWFESILEVSTNVYDAGKPEPKFGRISRDTDGVLHGRDMASPNSPHITPRPFIGVPIDATRNRLAAQPPISISQKTSGKKSFKPQVFTVYMDSVALPLC